MNTLDTQGKTGSDEKSQNQGFPAETEKAPIEVTEEKAAVRGGTKGQDRELPENLRGRLAGAMLLLTMAVLAIAVLHSGTPTANRNGRSTKTYANVMATPTPGNDKTSIPNLKPGQTSQPSKDGRIQSSELEETAKHQKQETVTTQAAATLGQISPFNQPLDWQPPTYQSGIESGNADGSLTPPMDEKSQRDALEKPSLVFVTNTKNATLSGTASNTSPVASLDLPTGTRLRAHLETVATTAVAMPVIAVIDYNYQRNGQILVPAGTRAIGRVEQADRTGYLSVRFESLSLPDGSTLQIQGVAAALSLRPLKGKVEGSHSGRNILIRSLSGIGQAGSMVVGHSSLNQSLSESDLMRQQLASNIGEVSDQEIARSAVTERVVISVPANTSIYVILQRPGEQPSPAKHSTAAGHSSSASNAQDLERLLQLYGDQNGATAATQKPE